MKQEQIENLTNEKNYLDKKIKKAKKQLAVMDFLTDKFGYTTKGSAIAISFFFIGILSALVLPQNLLWLSTMTMFVPSLSMGAGLLHIKLSLKEKTEEKLKELLEKKEEIEKQIECLKSGETYVPKQTEEKEDVFDSLIRLMINSQEKKKESLENTNKKSDADCIDTRIVKSENLEQDDHCEV